MNRRGFIFPGQGAQYPGMIKDLVTTFPSTKETIEEAETQLQRKLVDSEEIHQTIHSQLGIFVLSIALLRMYKTTPVCVGGLSLGEYSALHASESITFADALHLIEKRATFMAEACHIHPGGMTAIVGLSEEEITRGLKDISGVSIANLNAPGQIVISGTREGIKKGEEALKKIGAKKCIPLSVEGAFHSILMKSAKKALQPFIQATPFKMPTIDSYMNVSGKRANSVEEIKHYLIEQVTAPVRWEEEIRRMAERCDLFVEIGPGKTLAGLNRRMGIAQPTEHVW